MSSDPNPNLPTSVDLAAVRAKLAQENGKRFWQSLEQLAETKEYREFLENEFPHDPAKDPQGLNRRDVLKFAAASAALAGLSACTKLPTQKIVPYVKAPEEIVAGKPLFYATSMPLAGVAAG
ncbi:MAG: TAT-variant-translocated molybdopterin oxidoreductase, partial [Candidatus Acidiferrales bacterium]